ncbi:hypothetical protein E2493_03915 [Sphingomonas parva]|uniref:DUF2231 domain-containing protein n=1 Tax=Sphingomonas parva TaxID=2555898 RepID=A0A4Y8ZYF2_9SPHN|nr:DUF2231 domain-containing protein [Sphingomonas parva]TFI59626.1 hypothetical protein E2493_03915 [Sphingomonas parva]
MATQAERRPHRPIHPLQAFLTAGALPLFVGGLLSDLAYSSNYQIQWINFAAWLIAGAMVFTGFALLGALIGLVRARPRRGWPLLSFLLLLVVFVLGLINSFVHARDAFGTMPQGLILSVIVTVLAIAIVWIGFSSLRVGATK